MFRTHECMHTYIYIYISLGSNPGGLAKIPRYGLAVASILSPGVPDFSSLEVGTVLERLYDNDNMTTNNNSNCKTYCSY